MSSKITSQYNVPQNADLASDLREMEEARYLILIADRKKAFLFLFVKGEIEAKKEVMDPGVQKDTRINSGELYGRNNKLMHHIDNQLHSHLKLVVKEAETLLQGKHINGIFLGGHKPLFHNVVEALPEFLKQKIKGEFVTELNIPELELIAHCQKILKEHTEQLTG